MKKLTEYKSQLYNINVNTLQIFSEHTKSNIKIVIHKPRITIFLLSFYTCALSGSIS